ncbi:MAG: response regulator [Deltaproteobacteria bacterium]|nr:response regulator [Deltaproteobacteria bacterium]
MDAHAPGPILLVEDNPDDVALTLRALKKNKIENAVVVAKDGVEALDFLFSTGPHSGRDPEPPALMLLDLKLPRVDGLEVLQRMRQDPRTRLLRVVVLTTSAEDRDIQRAYELGATSYVCKPVDFDLFLTAMGALGRYWLELNVPPPAA